ncbi:MAG: M23 family metallopeptidase [Acidobacteriota bacterium]
MKSAIVLSLLLSAAICLGDDIAANQGTLYSGIWQSGTDANYYSVDLTLQQLKDLATTRHGQSLRIVDIETYLKNGARRWAAVWRSGTDANYFSVALSAQQFKDLATQRHGQNLRLVDIETYLDGSQRVWAGVWRGGSDAEYYTTDLTLDELKTLATERHGKSLRIVDLETYGSGGQRRWAALWRSGTDANYFSVGLSSGQFSDLLEERHKQNLRIVSMTSYVESGSRKWAGVWRSGTYANWVSLGLDSEYFLGLAVQRHATSLRIVGLDIYPTSCDDGCLNQAVMPKQYTLSDGTVQTNSGYDYGITRTATHCPGLPNTCGSPGAGATVVYHWPVDMSGDQRVLRISAVTGISEFLKLPFKDPDVKRRGIWRYSNKGWHHAGDYQRDDVGTFNIVASAAGRVIHIGWDSWSGGTMVVSHDVGGVTDAYRTIYMHLRNGAVNDCKQAWSMTVPTLSGDALTTYKNFLTSTGCTKNNPSPAEPQWGTNAQAIDMSLLGKQVNAGDFLAKAGSTGPGGCGCMSGGMGPNTHLHIFWAHRDLTNNEWYFFDPYGIYAMPDCYPANVTDTITTSCARYPVAWKNRKPQYP